MIRKVIHIILVLVLLTTSTGMTIYSHYCGSTLESVSIDKVPHSCCGDDCKDCHNESVTIKIHDDYSATTFTFDFHLFELALPAVQTLLVEEPTVQTMLFVLMNDLPPPPIQTLLSSLQTYRLWFFETIWMLSLFLLKASVSMRINCVNCFITYNLKITCLTD